MKKINIGIFQFFLLIILFASCQKLDRPALDPNYPKDPDPPAYNPLKSFWAFEDNVTDQGESDLNGTASNLSYVTGIKGKAVKIGAAGYLLCPTIGETTVHPNGFVGIPSDTLSNLGSFTVSFWMNGDGSATGGPINDGAQGIFAISHKTQFWGNLEMFLENYTDATDANAVWLKIHMFNSGVAGGGEVWIADNNSKLKNVLHKWTHIALSYNAATSSISLYKDGVATPVDNMILGAGSYGKMKFDQFNGIALGTFAFQTNPSLTNHGPEPWAKSFNGALDQFRLYNKALSASEITALFTNKD
jgi:hypothetical protein